MTKEQEDIKQLQKEVSLICMHLYQIKKADNKQSNIPFAWSDNRTSVINAHPVHRF